MNYEDRSPLDVSYHVQLLDEAGLIVGMDMSTTTGVDWRPSRLTWAGHEFLDEAREETFWRKAKATVLEKTGGLSFEVLKNVLFKMATDAVLGG